MGVAVRKTEKLGKVIDFPVGKIQTGEVYHQSVHEQIEEQGEVIDITDYLPKTCDIHIDVPTTKYVGTIKSISPNPLLDTCYAIGFLGFLVLCFL